MTNLTHLSEFKHTKLHEVVDQESPTSLHLIIYNSFDWPQPLAYSLGGQSLVAKPSQKSKEFLNSNICMKKPHP